MNKRTFIKTLGLGGAAITIGAPLSLVATGPEVQEDFELTEFSFIPAPIRFLGAEWIPTRVSLDSVIRYYVEVAKEPTYAIIIEFKEEQKMWQVEEIICEDKDKKNVPPPERWNGMLAFDSYFDTPEREKLNKQRYYVAFVPITPYPWFSVAGLKRGEKA